MSTVFVVFSFVFLASTAHSVENAPPENALYEQLGRRQGPGSPATGNEFNKTFSKENAIFLWALG